MLSLAELWVAAAWACFLQNMLHGNNGQVGKSTLVRPEMPNFVTRHEVNTGDNAEAWGLEVVYVGLGDKFLQRVRKLIAVFSHQL